MRSFILSKFQLRKGPASSLFPLILLTKGENVTLYCYWFVGSFLANSKMVKMIVSPKPCWHFGLAQQQSTCVKSLRPLATQSPLKEPPPVPKTRKPKSNNKLITGQQPFWGLLQAAVMTLCPRAGGKQFC